jgi:hypothetical protein
MVSETYNGWRWGRGDLRADSILLGNLLLIIHIDFGEGNCARLRKLGRERFEYWRDSLAWSTPVGINCLSALERVQEHSGTSGLSLQSVITTLDDLRMLANSAADPTLTVEGILDFGLINGYRCRCTLLISKLT